MGILSSLKGREVFSGIFKVGTRWVNRYLVLYRAPGEAGCVRLGITISRKYGKAVRRNLLRRRLREYMRTRQERLQTGWDVVLIPRKGIEELSSHEQTGCLGALLTKAGLLVPDGR